MAKKNVVVIGGGFVGLGAARHLCSHFNVTIVDAKEFFEFAPGMCGPYVDPDYHAKLVLDYKVICEKMGVKYVMGHADALRDGNLKVRVGGSHPPSVEDKSSEDEHARFEFLTYDYCIVSTGCQYGIPFDIPHRAAEVSACLWYPTLTKTPANCVTHKHTPGLDERILDGRFNHIAHEHRKLTRLNETKGHIVVIGAGPVGVEYAGEVKHHFKDLQVTIIEARGECCGPLPASAKVYVQKRLEAMGIKTFYNVKHNELLGPSEQCHVWEKLGIPAPDRVYMAVGVRPQSWFMPKDSLTPGARGGWINVNENMQVVRELDGGVLEPIFDNRIYAAGNCVGPVPGVGSVPKNSYPGEDMAALACKNILATEKGKALKAFRYNIGHGITMTSIGPNDGVLVINNKDPGSGQTPLKGRLVCWLKEIIRFGKVDECKLGCLGTIMFKYVH